LATPAEMPHAGSDPMKGHSDPNLVNWSAVSLHSIFLRPGSHVCWTLLYSASYATDWWQFQTNFDSTW
jgi:hypothetical protein